jgi:hypothetical protein
MHLIKIYLVYTLSLDHNQAGLKETKSIESMRTVDKLTDQDGISQLYLPTVHHAPAATTVDGILSNDHTQDNLSEQLKETELTFSNNNHISLSRLERQALQDRYDSIGAPKWNVVHGGTHRDFSNIPSAENRLCRTCMSPPMARTGTTAPPLLEPTGASMILMLILV